MWHQISFAWCMTRHQVSFVGCSTRHQVSLAGCTDAGCFPCTAVDQRACKILPKYSRLRWISHYHHHSSSSVQILCLLFAGQCVTLQEKMWSFRNSKFSLSCHLYACVWMCVCVSVCLLVCTQQARHTYHLTVFCQSCWWSFTKLVF